MLKVMIVDEAVERAEVLQQALTRAGYEVIAYVPSTFDLHRQVAALQPDIVIIDTDWDSLVWAATDRHRAARIAAAWNEHLPDPYLPRSLAPRLREAGFEVREIRIVPILNTPYDATTFSYNIAALIAAFVPGRVGISEDEATEWLNDLAELQHQGRYFFSINRYLFAASRPQSGGPRSATGL